MANAQHENESRTTTEIRRLSRIPALAVAFLWLTELSANWWAPTLDAAWPAWKVGFWAVAVWGANLVVLYYGVGPPFAVSRVPMLSALFGFVMTLLGSANYWATTHIFPQYRVFIERAALFVAVCTLLSLLSCVGIKWWAGDYKANPSGLFVWNWGRVRLLTYSMLILCLAGTYVSIQRIGFVPLFQGDPESLRFTFPAIAGIWLRFSTQLGILVALMAGVQVCARRSNVSTWAAGICGILCASMYGNRFFAALPVGVILLLWDQVRSRVSIRIVAIAFLVGVPLLALLGYWRYQSAPVNVLSPLMVVLFGTLMEFRDLGWTMEYYSGGHPLLHGSTLGGLFMPFLPSPIWSALGVDKATVYAHSNAVVLGQQMWQLTPQRVGLYGELFMNFGWLGAFVGALIYGGLLAYVDRRFGVLRSAEPVRAAVLAIVAVALIYAQIGQWDMDTTAVTSTCYPILLLALVSARRKVPGP